MYFLFIVASYFVFAIYLSDIIIKILKKSLQNHYYFVSVILLLTILIYSYSAYGLTSKSLYITTISAIIYITSLSIANLISIIINHYKKSTVNRGR